MNTNCILFKQTKKKKIKQMFCREGWGGGLNNRLDDLLVCFQKNTSNCKFYKIYSFNKSV